MKMRSVIGAAGQVISECCERCVWKVRARGASERCERKVAAAQCSQAISMICSATDS